MYIIFLFKIYFIIAFMYFFLMFIDSIYENYTLEIKNKTFKARKDIGLTFLLSMAHGMFWFLFLVEYMQIFINKIKTKFN